MTNSSLSIQRKFSPDLNLKDANDLKERLEVAGHTVAKAVRLATWFNNESTRDRVLSDIPGIVAAINDFDGSIITGAAKENAPVGAASAALGKEPAQETEEREAATRKVVETASKKAAEVAIKMVAEKQAPVREATGGKAATKEEAEGKVDKKDLTERKAGEGTSGDRDAGPLVINYVWLGNGKLGALEKFNIYSWRALGHAVNIYASRFDQKQATSGSLGIEDGDANVIDLREQLVEDKEEAEKVKDGPKAKLIDARGVLESWIDAAARAGLGEKRGDDEQNKKDEDKTRIYNMVDITKSYIGATQRGIVLDMKVGPSEHLPAFAESFSHRFISYSRGGKTGAEVENQSMGTMQAGEDIRKAYAESFNANVKLNMEGERGMKNKAHEPWFNLITGFHGRAFGKEKTRGLNVATRTPTGEMHRGIYPVNEPVAPGQGPFRVFKAAGEQSNQGGGTGLTTQAVVYSLAEEVFRRQLQDLNDRAGFVTKAKGAMDSLKPKEK